MSYCSNCGMQIVDDTKFCPECGSLNTSDATNFGQRQHEFKGKIIKCPNCGEVLRSFEGICPACGHEINSVRMSVSFKTFVDAITECDDSIAKSPVPPKKGFRTWSKCGKFLWVVLNVFTFCIPLAFYLIMPFLGIWGVTAFLPDEKRKATLIKNYAFPNDRESVLEILLYIKSQMGFIASEKIDRNVVHWASIWGHKAEQIYQKAEIIIKGDTISASAHSDIMLNWKKIKRSFRIRLIIAASIGVLIILLTFGDSLLYSLSNTFESISDSLMSAVPKVVGALQWPNTELTNVIPDPESSNGEIMHNDEEELRLSVYDFSESKYELYLNEIKNYGFTIDSETNSISYKAYNKSGYHINIYDESNQYDWSELFIVLEAPMKMETVRWPKTKLVKQIPVPKKDFGKIDGESGSSFTAYIGNTTPDEYADYVDACMDKGFTEGLYSRDNTHFYGDNSAGSTIRVDYIGFNIMKINIYNYSY